MATFTPPTLHDVPPVLPLERGIAYRLFRYFPNRARYVTVFALSDGTFVQDTATPENSNTSVPYPYDPYSPGAPYSTSYYTNFDVSPPVQAKLDVSHDVYIKKVYMAPQYVTPDEVTALTSAGYGALIS